MAGGVGAVLAVAAAGGIGYGVADSQGDEQYGVLQDELVSTQGELTSTQEQLTTTQDDVNDATVASNGWEKLYNQTARRVETLEGDRAALEAARDELRRDAKQLEKREAAVQRAETIEAQSRFPGDGTFIVGEDVNPGTYRAIQTIEPGGPRSKP